MDEENQANTLVSVAPLPQEPLDKPTVNRESPPENGTSPTTNGHSASGSPVADTEMWITCSRPPPWHTHTGPSPYRHRCYCRGRLHLPFFFLFFLNIQCIYMDLSIPVLNDIPIMIILNICCRIPFPFGCFQDTNRNMMFTCTNTKMGYLKIQAKPRYSGPCKRMDINHKAHDHMTIRAMPIMWKVEDHCAFRLTRGTSSVPMT